MAKKSLSEQIAALANKPKFQDFDIEDENFNNGNKFGSDEESYSDESDEDKELKKKEHYVQMGKSKLRSKHAADDEATGVLRDKRYTGSKGSRDELFGDKFATRPEEEEEDSDSDSDSGVDLDDVSSSDEEMDDEQDSEENEGEHIEEDEDEDSDVEDKRSKLLQLKAQTQQTVSKSYTASQTKDALKGYSIIQQNKFFDNIIDARIKLQKAINQSNTLPLTKKSWNSLQDKKTEKLLNENMELLSSVLNKIVDIRLILQKTDKINTAIDDEKLKETVGSKRPFNEVQQTSESLDSQLNKYRKVVLYKWSNKINQTQGVGFSSSNNSNSISSKKFSAINQTSDVQVETQLADQQRLLKRTYLNRRGVVPLNFEEDYKSGSLAKMQPSAEDRDADNAGDDDNLDIPKNYNPRLKSNIDTSENPYIFDDEDFYRILLNDLVDKKINNANSVPGNSTQQVRLVTSSTNKIKNKNIDTKASKGRKLNFQVQEPIAHYEAPVNNHIKWTDEQIDEFFAGLLGQAVNFNEHEKKNQDFDD